MNYDQHVVPLAQVLTALAVATRLPSFCEANSHKSKCGAKLQSLTFFTKAKKLIATYVHLTRFRPVLRERRESERFKQWNSKNKKEYRRGGETERSSERFSISRIKNIRANSSLEVELRSSREEIGAQTERCPEQSKLFPEEFALTRHRPDFTPNSQRFLLESESKARSEAQSLREAAWLGHKQALQVTRKQAIARAQDDLIRSSEQLSLSQYSKQLAVATRKLEREDRANDRKEFVRALKANIDRENRTELPLSVSRLRQHYVEIVTKWG